MERRRKDTLRAGVTAFGVAAGLLALATTAQTPDGYIHASFGGPLDVFASDTTDVMSIGDGANDATELAALLKGPVGPAAKTGSVPDSPYRVAYEAGAAPNATTGSVTIVPQIDPTFAPSGGKDPAILPSKPVVDSQGRIDCTGAVSCRTDPSTNVTTVTYPDGVVAIVQKINDLTVVAYKTITEALPDEIASLLPPAPGGPPPLLAAVAPAPETAPTSSVAPTPTQVPAVEATVPSVDPGPPAVDLSPADTRRAPKVDISLPPKDFLPGQNGSGPSLPPPPKLPALGKVKDTINGVVDSVKDAVNKALNPGASSKAPSKGESKSESKPSGNSTPAGAGAADNDSPSGADTP